MQTFKTPGSVVSHFSKLKNPSYQQRKKIQSFSLVNILLLPQVNRAGTPGFIHWLLEAVHMKRLGYGKRVDSAGLAHGDACTNVMSVQAGAGLRLTAYKYRQLGSNANSRV